MNIILIILSSLLFSLGIYDIFRYPPDSRLFFVGIFLIVINTVTITINTIVLTIK